MSGDYGSKREAAHLMVPGVGRKVIDLGGNIKKGLWTRCIPRYADFDLFLAPTLKLIGNGIIMSANELLSESLTLGEKCGIGASVVNNLVKGV